VSRSHLDRLVFAYVVYARQSLDLGLQFPDALPPLHPLGGAPIPRVLSYVLVTATNV
jgi:hypothetical protein